MEPNSSSPSGSQPEQNKTEEPEVAAASAAEITYGKKSEEATDLSDLAAALEPVPHTPSEEAGATSEAVVPADAEPERVLTKEEMIEEALNCPCVAGMREGPCGDSFISAYRCFLESETEPKGMDCMEQFTGMQTCMAENPEAYNLDDEDDDPFAAGDGAGSEDVKTEVEKEKVDQAVARDAPSERPSEDPVSAPKVSATASS